VRDLTGKISAGGEREACAETTRPPFFNGCAFAPGRQPGGAAVALALVLLFVLGRRRHAR
jgi:MYXO-CTERM domain-containing protein